MGWKRKKVSLLSKGEYDYILSKTGNFLTRNLYIAACNDYSLGAFGEKSDHSSCLLLCLGCDGAAVHHNYICILMTLQYRKTILGEAVGNGFAFTLVETTAKSIDIYVHAFSPFFSLYPTFSSAMRRECLISLV